MGEELLHHRHVLGLVADAAEEPRLLARPLQRDQGHEAGALGVAEVHRPGAVESAARNPPCARPTSRHSSVAVTPRWLLRVRPTWASGWKLTRLKASRLRDQPAHHVGDLREVVLGDGEGHGGAQGPAGAPAGLADHRREFLAQGHQLQLGLRRLVAVPPALGDVDVDRDLGQAPLGHQPLEQPRPAAEVVAVGHHHGDDADRPRVAQDLGQLLDRPQGHLAVGDLDVALRAQPAAQLVELRAGSAAVGRAGILFASWPR